MNKRAKQRLIIVTALIVVVTGGLMTWVIMSGGAYSRSISEVLDDPALVGQQIEVSGEVVDGSFTPGARPLVFDIREQDSGADGPTLRVSYDGVQPSAFGGGTVAIVTGILGEDGLVTAKTLITQCPSKYESSTDALGVGYALDSADRIVGKYVKVTGIVEAGSIASSGSTPRFTLEDTDGGATLPVDFDGALPEGFEEGVQVVVSGVLDDGTFVAEDVAIATD